MRLALIIIGLLCTPYSSVAQGKTPEDVARELIVLYDEINDYGEGALQEYGFSQAGPHYDWLKRVRALRQEPGFFNGTGLFCSAGQLISYGFEMKDPAGERDEWIVETAREDFEACRAKLDGT